ncbi:MAG: hypothetical protein ACREKK_05545, partial [Candidatus Methylomirabilales bacterium]
DLEGLFRAAEIPTIWRDRFVRIAFAPYTRVDLRRLRQQGLITHEQVIEGYMDLGYDADKAAVLTEFAELDAGAEERALAKGEVINLFGAELIDRDTAQQLLEATGLAPHWAAMRLDLAQSQKAQQAQDRRINVVRSRYLAFKATRTEAAAALDGVAVPFETREALIAEWDALREATTRDLSEAQLAEALRREIITESEYVTRLVEQGYTTRDAEILSGIRGAQRAARGGGAA